MEWLGLLILAFAFFVLFICIVDSNKSKKDDALETFDSWYNDIMNGRWKR